jgi:hypothetical protein
MKTITVQRKKIEWKQYIRRSAVDDDYSELIAEPCIIKDENGEIVAVYGILNIDTQQLRQAVLQIRMGKNRRTMGLRTQSRIFGYMPREEIRKDYCSSTVMAREQPKQHAIVCRFAETLSKYYETYAPEIFTKHVETVNKVLPEWKIANTPFTSGIINKNNPLKYHLDRGNFPNLYSNMVCFRKDVVGGHLALPEYDIGLDISDNSIVFFDGQKIIHGVTPITFDTPEAYRFTLVYYSLARMWQCKPVDEEIARIQQRRTELENQRYMRATGQLKDDPWADKIGEITKDDELNLEEEFRGTIR